MNKQIRRKGITFEIEQEGDEDIFILFISDILGIDDESLLGRYTEYLNGDELEDAIFSINNGEFDYLPRMIKDIYKLKEKWDDFDDEYEQLTKYIYT